MIKIFIFSFLILISDLLNAQIINTNCDSTVYFLTEQMPYFIGDYNQVINQIDLKASLNIKNLIKEHNPEISILINCNGQVRTRMADNNLYEFNSIVSAELNKLKWIPAYQKDSPVSVQTIVPIRVINYKIVIPQAFAEIRGKLLKAKIINEETKEAIQNVIVYTDYNNNTVKSNEKGEVSFYCEPNMPVLVSHINFSAIKFTTIDSIEDYTVSLKKVNYILEDLNLVNYNPDKLPNKGIECSFQNWSYAPTMFRIVGVNDENQSHVAEFNDGYNCFQNYICKNFILPKEAILNNYTDTVTIKFIISTKGLTRNVRLSKELKYNVGKTIEDLFKNMPTWKPASQENIPVYQEFEIKIIFGVNKYWKKLLPTAYLLASPNSQKTLGCIWVDDAFGVLNAFL